jgi:glucokinase
MKILLAGDVGGTKTLLSLVKIELNQKPVTLHSDRYPSQNFKSLTEIIRQFLNEATQKLGYSLSIETACFGIAGAVANNTSFLTNLKWSLDGEVLQTELGIAQIKLINDFAAVGYGILGLETTDLHSIQTGTAIAKAPIALIGAGTGLGMGFLTWNHDSYEVHASEGGHRDFSPRNQTEIALLEFLLQRHDRVSIERVISGNGIVSIYQFLRSYRKQNTSTPLANMLQAKEEGDSTVDLGSAIATAAINKTDPLAIEAIQIFLDAYASEIGNLALEILPYAGVFIAGGIAPKLLSLIDEGQAKRFLSNVKQKGRVSPMLDLFPIQIVLNQNVGLIGTIVYGSHRIAF